MRINVSMKRKNWLPGNPGNLIIPNRKGQNGFKGQCNFEMKLIQNLKRKNLQINLCRDPFPKKFKTQEECQKLCQQKNYCNFWVWHHPKKQCFLTDYYTDETEYAVNMTWGHKSCKDNCYKFFYTNKYIWEHNETDYTRIRNVWSFYDCKEYCKNHTNCLFFDWNVASSK